MKHIERLGLYDAADYLQWCRARGFRTSFQKSWNELEAEWCAYGQELSRARFRCRGDRDPARVLAGVCNGSTSASDLARPRWRALAQRIENAHLPHPEREALRVLVELVERRGNLLLAEGEFGGVRHPFVDGLVALSRRHLEWIRDPREWRARSHNARRQFASLARHLMARFPVPGFLDAAWLRSDADAERYREWFRCIGAGENLRRAEAPVPLTNRIVHHFLRAPEHVSIEQAIRWGQIFALGGDRRLVDAVLGSRIGERFADEEFWISVIRFFVAHPQLDRRHVGPIVDYLQDQRFETRDVFIARGLRAQLPPAQPNLSMKGRSTDSLLRQVDRWHRALARTGPGASRRWERSGIGEFELETGVRGRDLRVWRIRELLSAAELRHEGSVLRHCVASYAGACAAGRSSIWTLERWGFEGVRKHQTIEVNAHRVIVQSRGRFNQPPTAQERQILARWAEQEELQVGRFL